MNANLSTPKPRLERLDGRLFLTEENLDRGTMTLLAAARRVEAILRQSIAEEGLTQTEFAMLMEIAYDPGLDVSELRERVSGTVPTVARLLASLDKRGWVSRPKAQTDGRRKSLRLSPEGEALMERILASLRKDMMQVYRRAGEPSVSGALDLLDAVSQLSGESTSS
ncbi:MAG: hypothetical protein CMK06_09365 [Ponticaulis sp.]|nr:hypothetical protein [Ponticaulis sp.]|tara:strand:+ start:12417 stop:12917 length:501 start_codon:yes stop_codon:yes gene_type:complete